MLLSQQSICFGRIWLSLLYWFDFSFFIVFDVQMSYVKLPLKPYRIWVSGIFKSEKKLSFYPLPFTFFILVIHQFFCYFNNLLLSRLAYIRVTGIDVFSSHIGNFSYFFIINYFPSSLYFLYYPDKFSCPVFFL